MAFKRRFADDSSGSDRKSQRMANWNDIEIGGDIIFAKCLIPSPIAGYVIGKGGETIEKLQKEIGLRIRLSKSTDLYPGTNDRVCIMKGTVEQLTQFVQLYYLDKVIELEAREQKQQRMDVQQNGRYEFKMIVPVETVSRIIGNAGATVKEIIKKTKTFIQVSQRPPPNIILPERVMKIAGEVEAIISAVKEVLSRFKDDPNHADHTFVSYKACTYVPNAFPAGQAVTTNEARALEDGPDPYSDAGQAVGAGKYKAERGDYNGTKAGYGAAAAADGNEDDGAPRLAIAHDKTPVDPDVLRNYMTGFTKQLQNLGCPSTAMQEIIYSIDTLAKYHLLAMMGGKPKQASQSALWTAPGQSVGYNAIYAKPQSGGMQSGGLLSSGSGYGGQKQSGSRYGGF